MRARKRFGQHFLEPAWADKLVSAIEPHPSDRFLEIGPGAGALTLRLAPRVAHLTAVEIDRDLAAALRSRLPPNVDLVEADFLEYDVASLVASAPLRVVGNLPYNISSPILFKLIDLARTGSSPPDTSDGGPPQSADAAPPRTGDATGRLVDATIMVQREVADRIAAAPGTRDYGVLSISVQLHADVRRVLTLPPGAFRPPPKVHSAVVRLAFRLPTVDLRDEALFEAMVRSMFTQRRKTIARSLAAFAAGRGADAGEALRAAGIDGRRRAETLQLPELAALANALAAAGA